jgi:hypothetical protein
LASGNRLSAESLRVLRSKYEVIVE